jgi:type IV pilus assembly protein PilO
MKRNVPFTFVLAGALVIVLAVSYMILIRPKRAESGRLDAEIAELESKIAADAKQATAGKEPEVRINVADLFRLAKAMPDEEDMPGIILEVNSIASSAGIEFLAIQPQPAVAAGSRRALPITLTFEGNYYDLTDFLYRLRTLVTVKDGTLHTSGRLYTLDALDMHEAKTGFPHIEAVLTVSAYAFGSATPTAAAPGAPAQAAPPETETTETTTGEATTAEGEPPSGEQAPNEDAGANP